RTACRRTGAARRRTAAGRPSPRTAPPARRRRGTRPDRRLPGPRDRRSPSRSPSRNRSRTPSRRGPPACRAGRNRTGDQPSLALRQDGRVMTVTLSREKHTVTNARRPVRHERSATQRSDTQGQPMPVVAVTGAARGIGHALTVRLAASPDVRKVIAIDSDRGDIAGVAWRVADVRGPAPAGRLARADVRVHAEYDPA